MKKILVCEFQQETNTFNPTIMPLARFNAGGAFEGEAVFADRMKISHPVHGAVDVFKQAGVQTIPTIFMFVTADGRVSDDAVPHFCERFAAYAKENSFDGIYAALHGATCTESDDDACGTILEFMRGIAGDKPIAASFDLHANITEKVLRNADVVCGYQTYPHNDQYEVGCRAASLCLKKLAGEDFSLASAAVPMLIPPSGYTTNEGAFKELIACGKKMVEDGKLLDFTVFAVQPWMDIKEIASRIIAISASKEDSLSCADVLAQMLFDLRDEAQPELFSVDAIIDIAESNTTGKPVVLSESADSPNGGCVGDSPSVAMRLLERGSSLRAGMFVKDPEAVKRAFALGVGGTGEFSVGAYFTPGIPGPLVATGTVCSLHDGSFTVEGPAWRGKTVNLGPCAVVRFGTVDILLVNNATHTGDPQFFRHFGIEPTLYDLIVVKANTSFRLPYGKFTDLIYCADTIGAGASNLKKLQWNNLPDGLYPFTDNVKPEKAKIW